MGHITEGFSILFGLIMAADAALSLLVAIIFRRYREVMFFMSAAAAAAAGLSFVFLAGW